MEMRTEFSIFFSHAFDTFDSLIKKKGNKFNSIDFSDAFSFNESAFCCLHNAFGSQVTQKKVVAKHKKMRND